VVEKPVDDGVDAAGDEHEHLGDDVQPDVDAHLGCGRRIDVDDWRLCERARVSVREVGRGSRGTRAQRA